jgi:hypothetical protein
MKMSRQIEKYLQSMAGEFFVAAQLQRLGINASVTYGNAKRADIVIFSNDYSKCSPIEVKTTRKDKWAIGCPIPMPSSQPWVFVYLPAELESPPEYFVLSQEELHLLMLPIQNEYFSKYEERHGVPYGDKPGNFSLPKILAVPYKNNWSTILRLIENET